MVDHYNGRHYNVSTNIQFDKQQVRRTNEHDRFLSNESRKLVAQKSVEKCEKAHHFPIDINVFVQPIS